MADEVGNGEAARDQPISQVNAAHRASHNGSVFVVHDPRRVPILEFAPDPITTDEVLKRRGDCLAAMERLPAQHTLLVAFGGVHAP